MIHHIRIVCLHIIKRSVFLTEMQRFSVSYKVGRYTGRFKIFSVITNIYNKKTKGPTLMELFTATGKLKKFFFFDNYRCSMCAPRVTRHTSIRYSSSLDVNGRPLDFCFHRHPVSVNCLYDARMVLSVGGSFAYFARNARCTVTTDLLCDIPTHKINYSPAWPYSHYIYSHRLAVEM